MSAEKKDVYRQPSRGSGQQGEEGKKGSSLIREAKRKKETWEATGRERDVGNSGKKGGEGWKGDIR